MTIAGSLAATLMTLATMVLATATATAAPSEASVELQIASLHNNARASFGLAPLRWSDTLASVARAHSDEMATAGDIWHQQGMQDRLFGWESLGDNVGRGPSARALHDAFMDSPEHRQNILATDFRLFGVGAAVNPDGIVYVTVIFEVPRNVSPNAPRPAQAKPASRSVTMLLAMQALDAGWQSSPVDAL